MLSKTLASFHPETPVQGNGGHGNPVPTLHQVRIQVGWAKALSCPPRSFRMDTSQGGAVYVATLPMV